MQKRTNDEDQDYISITEARRELPSLPDRLRDAPGAIAVTKREKPVLAIMPWELSLCIHHRNAGDHG